MGNQNRNRSILPIIFLCCQALFIIIIISIIATNATSDEIGQTDYDRKHIVSIENLDSQLPYAPYSGPIRAVLTETIELNSTEFSPSDSVANIRDGSLSTIRFENIDSVYFGAIVDIPNLQQSYQIYALYPLDTNNFNLDLYNTQYVLCLDNYSEKIYPDFNCHDLFGSNTRQVIVSRYLPYFNFNDFTASISQDLNTIGILPLRNGSVTDEIANSYIERTREAIASLGISPDLFEYTVFRSTNPADTNYSLNQP